MRTLPLLVAGLLFGTLIAQGEAQAAAQRDRFGAAGYFRIMTRPDFEGGDTRLGFSNLYGRLLNEGPWGTLELTLDMLPRKPGSTEVWTRLLTRVEGGSVFAADVGRGNLSNFFVSRLFVEAGNIAFDNVTWRLGTLWEYMGDIGLYDIRGGQLFFETVGLSARYQTRTLDVLVGVGDSGFFVKGEEYNTLLTFGGWARASLLDNRLSLGVGGQAFYEPKVEGNRFAPHRTPNVAYRDFLLESVPETFFRDNPGPRETFPNPVATDALSFRVLGHLGFGQLGPLRWNDLFISFERRHPQNFYLDRNDDAPELGDFSVFTKGLTDERYVLQVINEMQLQLWPQHLDAALGTLIGWHFDEDNEIAPSDDDRFYYSFVLRLQAYLTRTIHLLFENSFAQEKSLQGNLYRNHADSPFRNSNDPRDDAFFERGDSDLRTTWQGKFGPVFNPLGLGVYTRPSLRLLYGVQYSTQNNAFGSSFTDSLAQDELFGVGVKERHWHHLIAIEAETWF